MTMPFAVRRSHNFIVSMILTAVLGLLALTISATSAGAHALNENYIWLNVEETGLSGRIEFSYDDLRNRLGIALPDDPEAISAALIENAPAVEQFISENLAIIAGGSEIALRFSEPTPAPGGESWFAAFHFTTEPFAVPDQITLRNDMLLSWDAPLYRSLLVVEYDRQRAIEYPPEFAVMAFGPNLREQELDLTDLRPVLTPRDFVYQGVLHIIAGPDHVLFLLALLLVSVLRLEPRRTWVPVDTPWSAVWNSVVIVTLFAIAHSATLTMTVLGLLQPNIQLIETLIALSIVVVALNNLYPLIDTERWLLIVFFGLFHGMGFASAMSNLQFRLVKPYKILINFNAGIELGQILIVAVILPLLYMARNTRFFRKGIFPFGNLAIVLIAGYWTITRALGV